MQKLVTEVHNCTICSKHLPLGPRPVISVSTNSKIAIIGQAPGNKVHASGIPWDDQSGKNLREWMGVDEQTFYDPSVFAIVPMGFCYPGRGKNGDLPPRKECAPLWHKALFDKMPNLELTLLIGKYAQDFYLDKSLKRSLTNTVKDYKSHLPNHFVLPHPSPLNNILQAKNEWFKREVLPELKNQVAGLLP
jgi:uracil-DNA glycosylase